MSSGRWAPFESAISRGFERSADDWLGWYALSSGAQPAGVVDPAALALPQAQDARLVSRTSLHDPDGQVFARAIRGLWGSVAHSGSAGELRIDGGPSGLSYRLALSPLDGLAATALRTAFPFAEITSAERPDQQFESAVDLVGIVMSEGVYPGSVADSLASIREYRWAMTVSMVPTRPVLLERLIPRVPEVIAAVSEHLHTQQTVRPNETKSFDDPLAETMLAELRNLEARLRLMWGEGGFICNVRVAAQRRDEVGEVAAVVGSRTGLRRADSTSGAALGLFTIPEVVALAAPPSSDVAGLPLRTFSALSRAVPAVPADAPSIRLGVTVEGDAFRVGLRDLTGHMLLVGATGTGKSTSVYSIIDQIVEAGVPVWVIEPVKSEYVQEYGRSFTVWTPGAPDQAAPFVLNPLEVPEGMSASEWTDELSALFRSTFALIDPLPSLVKLGISRLYEISGRDLNSCRGPDHQRSPTPSDLIGAIAALAVEYGYSAEIQRNIAAATQARLGVLATGALGPAFDRDRAFPIGDLIRDNFIVNLDHVRDQQTKSFLMGLLLLRVRAALSGTSTELRHLVVVEEAHRLASSNTRRTGLDDSSAGQPAADMFGDLLSEIRAAGQGVIMVDQRPSSLIPEAIANPATLVSLGLPHRDDQLAISAGVGLDASLPAGFGALRRHEALVKTRGMDRPALVRLHHRFSTGDRSDMRVQGDAGAAHVCASRELLAAVHTMLLSDGAGPECRARALEILSVQFPHVPEADRASAITRLAERSVHDLCRRRGVGEDVEREVVASLARGDGRNPGLRRVLLDGRQPYAGCAAVCPTGGCLVGDLVQPLAAGLAADTGGVLAAVSDVRTLEVRARRVAQDVVLAADKQLTTLAMKCAVVTCFDRHLPAPELSGLVGAVVGRGEDAQ